MTYWVKTVGPEVSTPFASIEKASIAFCKSLNRADEVYLVEETLLGDLTLAEKVRKGTPQVERHCPACGRRHSPDQHGGDPTAVRLLMAHHDNNHAQCHPTSACRIGVEASGAGIRITGRLGTTTEGGRQ